MSEHSGACGGTMRYWSVLRSSHKKACARTGKAFPFVVIQGAGLDGFWIDRVLQNEGIESHVVDAASIATSRRRSRARPTESTARRWFARCWRTSGANRGCARWLGHRRPRMRTAAASAVSVRC